jgi:hypothetical protein
VSSCYKCGKELPEGQVECEAGCHSDPSRQPTDTMAEYLEKIFRNRQRIDWAKVKTFEDMHLIMSTIFADAMLMAGSEEAIKLERFLKPKGER